MTTVKVFFSIDEFNTYKEARRKQMTHLGLRASINSDATRTIEVNLSIKEIKEILPDGTVVIKEN